MTLIKSKLVCKVCRTEVEELPSGGFNLVCPCSNNVSWTFLNPARYIRIGKLDYDLSLLDKWKQVWKIIKT